MSSTVSVAILQGWLAAQSTSQGQLPNQLLDKLQNFQLPHQLLDKLQDFWISWGGWGGARVVIVRC